MGNAVCLDVMQCGSCKNRVSEELIASITMVKTIADIGTALTVPSSLIILSLKLEAILSSETSVLTRARLRHIP
jgi:hypothetical protein